MKSKQNQFKCIHASDLHLGLTTFGTDNPKTGLNTRAEDGFNALKQLCEYAIDNTVKLVILSGDIFNVKTPASNVINEFYKYVNLLSKNSIDLFILSGNHDASKASMGSKKCALEIPRTLEISNVYSTDGNDDVLDLGYVQLYAPSYWDTNEELLNKINTASKDIDWDRPAILVAHLQTETETFKVSGAFEDLHITPLSYLTQHPWNYVALGHVHKYEQLHQDPPVYYASSLVRCTFSEEFDNKGFNVITIVDNQVKEIHRQEVECLKMLTLNGTQDELEEQLSQRNSSIFKNVIIRLNIKESDTPYNKKFFQDKFEYAFKFIAKIERRKIQHKKIEASELLSIASNTKRYFENHARYDELLVLSEQFQELDTTKKGAF